MDKEKYMYRCIQLAKNGRISAAPNPLVGAVVVYNDEIIGEGYHIKSGTAHAEVNAINSVKDKKLLSKSTIFVSLEPCSHTGKTPPCADLIIKSKIPHVVIGCQDPFGKVDGQGIKKLRDAGIHVEVGILEKECKELIHRFYTFHTCKRPYIILKWAQSKDGFIDKERNSGIPTTLSTPLTSLLTQKRRAETSAIMVGRKTALLDNPQLNVRAWYRHNPTRIVLDKNLSLNSDFHLFDQTIPTLVFNQIKESDSTNNIRYIKLDFSQDILPQIMDYLYQENTQSILIEGGATLHNTLIKNDLWDEIHIEYSNIIIGYGVKAPTPPKLETALQERYFGHTFIKYINHKLLR